MSDQRKAALLAVAAEYGVVDMRAAREYGAERERERRAGGCSYEFAEGLRCSRGHYADGLCKRHRDERWYALGMPTPEGPSPRGRSQPARAS